jgi:hypothetical protein
MSDGIISAKLRNGFNVPHKCPVKKGNYTGYFEPDFSAVPPNFDGKYKVVLNFYLPNGLKEEYIGFGEIHHYFT